MQRLFLLFFFCYSFFLFSQDITRKDSLRGNLTSLRTCYDVTFYDLNLAIDEQDQSIFLFCEQGVSNGGPPKKIFEP